MNILNYDTLLEIIKHTDIKTVKRLTKCNKYLKDICNKNKNYISKILLQNENIDIDVFKSGTYYEILQDFYKFSCLKRYKLNCMERGINSQKTDDNCLFKFWNKQFLQIEISNKTLMIATKLKNLTIIKYLIAKGIDIHTNEEAALSHSAADGNLDVVKYLVSLGADIHGGFLGECPLRWSAAKGHLEVVKYLVECGADIHANNEIALGLSAQFGHLEVVKYLVACGADIHANNGEALIRSIKSKKYKNNLKVVKYLVECGANIHVYNESRLLLHPWHSDNYLDIFNLLQRAAKYGNLEVVKYLVECGADIHADNEAALYFSMRKGYLDVMLYLIDCGANINIALQKSRQFRQDGIRIQGIDYI